LPVEGEVDPLTVTEAYQPRSDDDCEYAIGHDGHYDENNVWILDNDHDKEPEWRCLMRPLLKAGTVKVQEGEKSIEAKTVVAEKKALIMVHQRLVKEADKAKVKAECGHLIEEEMHKLQICELEKLREYKKEAD
jgi:hypothetical protein